jgi:quercetin dioxygenase-like cupin family protein
MKTDNLKNFVRGWIVGNFTPSLFQTENFEIAVLTHIKDEEWPRHYHSVADEYNCLIEGKLEVTLYDTNLEVKSTQTFVSGDIFVIEKGEVIKPRFLEDCKVLTIKIPSVIGDKYVV